MREGSSRQAFKTRQKSITHGMHKKIRSYFGIAYKGKVRMVMVNSIDNLRDARVFLLAATLSAFADSLHMIDDLPIPICKFARAHFSQTLLVIKI
jgi:hypothetical protein